MARSSLLWTLHSTEQFLSQSPSPSRKANSGSASGSASASAVQFDSSKALAMLASSISILDLGSNSGDEPTAEHTAPALLQATVHNQTTCLPTRHRQIPTCWERGTSLWRSFIARLASPGHNLRPVTDAVACHSNPPSIPESNNY
jgi:hypothetical protein